jgi:tetratricopeptide (TPR) repeat protein
MLNWLRKLLSSYRGGGAPGEQLDLINTALEQGDYQTVFRETSKIIARYDGLNRIFSRTGKKMFFNSDEEYNNYIHRFPGRSFIAWEYPVAPEAHYQRALAYERSGRLRSSRREIESSLADFPTSSKYLVELGYILLEMKYFEEARSCFEGAIVNDLTNSREYEASAQQGLGLTALELGDFVSARRSFIDSWRIGGSNRELISYLQLLSEIERDPRQRAEFYLARGSWALALSAFREALAVNQQDYEMHLGIAYVFKELERFEQAEKHIKRAFRYNPSGSESNFALGWVYMMQERYQLAEAEFHKAIAKNRYDPGYFVGLALLYLEQVKDGSAEVTAKLMSALNRALELDTGYPEPYLVKAEYYLQTKAMPKALRAVHRAIALSPGSQGAHVLASEIYLEMGHKRRSLFHLEEAGDFGRDTEQMRSLRSRLQDDNS